jgi:hypothetical protein
MLGLKLSELAVSRFFEARFAVVVILRHWSIRFKSKLLCILHVSAVEAIMFVLQEVNRGCKRLR